MHRHHLFRIETMQGDETFIVAEDEQRAVEIFSCSLALGDGDHVLYRVFDWDGKLPEDQQRAIEEVLEFGPIGIATFCAGCGWSVSPPG